MIHDAYMYTGIKTSESADISSLGSSDLYQVCLFILVLSIYWRGGGGG